MTHKEQSCRDALNAEEARSMMLSGAVARVRLAWNISSDEFFSIAAVFGRAEGLQMVKQGQDFFLERVQH
ncbi:hypothetical protein [Pseudomonas graminis]